MTITFYHNPRCSKSRQALALLEENGARVEVILYMETPPEPATLSGIVKKLGIPVRALLRRGEEEYKTLNLDDPTLTDDALLLAMNQHPRLMERPVAIKGKQAVIGRPPENVLRLL